MSVRVGVSVIGSLDRSGRRIWGELWRRVGCCGRSRRSRRRRVEEQLAARVGVRARSRRPAASARPRPTTRWRREHLVDAGAAPSHRRRRRRRRPRRRRRSGCRAEPGGGERNGGARGRRRRGRSFPLHRARAAPGPPRGRADAGRRRADRRCPVASASSCRLGFSTVAPAAAAASSAGARGVDDARHSAGRGEGDQARIEVEGCTGRQASRADEAAGRRQSGCDGIRQLPATRRACGSHRSR